MAQLVEMTGRARSGVDERRNLAGDEVGVTAGTGERAGVVAGDLSDLHALSLSPWRPEVTDMAETRRQSESQRQGIPAENYEAMNGVDDDRQAGH